MWSMGHNLSTMGISINQLKRDRVHGHSVVRNMKKRAEADPLGST